MIQLRNLFTAQIGRIGCFQIALFRIVEIIAYFTNGQTTRALKRTSRDDRQP